MTLTPTRRRFTVHDYEQRAATALPGRWGAATGSRHSHSLDGSWPGSSCSAELDLVSSRRSSPLPDGGSEHGILSSDTRSQLPEDASRDERARSHHDFDT